MVKKMFYFAGIVAVLIVVVSLSGIRKQAGKALVQPINLTPQETELKINVKPDEDFVNALLNVKPDEDFANALLNVKPDEDLVNALLQIR